MTGSKIDALNAGLRVLKAELTKDELAAQRVEIAIVTFDSDVHTVQDFVTVDAFYPPTLTAQGTTHMGSGIQAALDLITSRKQALKAQGLVHYRPWVFMITDGEPQGESEDILTTVVRRIRSEEDSKRVAFFAVGVEGADLEQLQKISVSPPKMLKGLNFSEMFVWLSGSMGKVAESRPGEKVALDQTSTWTV